MRIPSTKFMTGHRLTLCVLMDIPIYIGTISKGLPILHLKGSWVEILNYDVFLSLMVVLVS